ncbi:MAG: ADP-ribosylglycohydrolase family protein [Desulfuromonadaceae bacterium]|nr:ADP-ribosylglycohydrolase family protein [Desulfuromonadaceae bacterium]
MTNEKHKEAVVNSALWAAYGDALGFMSELTDRSGLKKRIGSDKIEQTVQSKRMVGGKFGADVVLPPGCYSDDTQLRLSTCRAIRGDGDFDVEAFAKVELPVWLSYALGAGRGTKVAASAFRKTDVNWFSNFFEEGGISYTEGGGNGAAMRIQPHVWASKQPQAPQTFILDVIKNSVTTHGHPRGFLGAVFHALSLAQAMNKSIAPGPVEWKEAIYFFERVPSIIKNDYELSTLWLPKWEQKSKYNLEDYCHEIKIECLGDIRAIESMLEERPNEAYNKILHSLGAFTDQFRGTGTKTAILASILAWLFKNESPIVPLQVSSNAFRSDTDTIATMAGAIIGATVSLPPDGPISDKEYIVSEAERLDKISKGINERSFHYPDLLKWDPPKTQIDVVRVNNGELFLAGISKASTISDIFESRGGSETIWQWLKLEFGQTILAKRRKDLIPVAKEDIPVIPHKQYNPEPFNSRIQPPQPSLFPNAITSVAPTLETLTSEVITSGFSPEVIGRNFLVLAEKSSSIEDAIGYAAILMKAINARKKKAEGNIKR